MHRYLKRCLIGMLALPVLFLGVANTAMAQASKLRIVFPSSSATLVLPLLVAQKKGWMDADTTFVSGDANAVRALLSGTSDVAIVGDFNVFAAIGEGARIKAIDSWQGVNDYNLIASPKIDKIQDIAGKVFGATGPGGPPEEFGKLLLKKYNVDASKVKFVAISGGHANILQAVIAGRADVGLVNTLTALQGVKSGKAKILTSVAREYPQLGYVYNIVREQTLNDPKFEAQLQTMVTAGIQAARFITKNPDEAADILLEKFPDLDKAMTHDVIRQLSNDRVWGVNGGMEAPAVEATLDVFRKTGLLKGEVSAAQVTDYRFVDKAIAKLGKE